MIRYFIPLLFAIACLQSSVAIAQTSIYGYVRDASTQERLVGASILIEGSTRGTTTNTFGFFSLPVGNSRAIVLRVSYLGYEPKVMSWQDSVSGAAPVMISLRTTGIQSPEVLIEARRNATPVISTSMGISSIAIQEVHTLPSVGGEVDLVKAVQLQSGVSSGQEWSNGLYVRGGGFDQNLILLDGVTIYNPNHLFGFFSIFNTDAVKNVELMKGGIPAEYGGRLSSVLSFTLNEGNREQMVWKGGISMIASRLSVEGPLSEDKSGSFLLSARRSYFDTFLWALNGFNGGSPDFYIYDLTAKANYSVSPDDRLMVSGYFGKDNLKHSSGPNDMDIFSIDLSWGNQAYAFRWNHLWSPSIFSNLALIYSDYASDQKSNVFNTVSGKEPSVRDVTMKVDGEYYCTERHTFRFGGEYIFHRFRATAGLFQGNDDAVTLNASEVQSYVSHEWSVADRLHVTEGIRCDYFSTARRAEIDPRMNVRLLISDDLSVKASYTRMHQFVHLLSTAVFSLPGDVYYPATDFLQPQHSQQISAGIFSSLNVLGMPDVESSLEVYYKEMNNLPMFRNKFSGPSDEQIRRDVVTGTGWAYGADIQLSKHSGAFTGWLSYSFLSAWRRYDEMNGGRAFHPKFERTHQLNIVSQYQVSGKWTLGAIFIIASGQPINIPRQKYFIFNQGQTSRSSEDYVLDYGDLYSARLPMYNRLDISATRSWEGWGAKWELFMNLYNVYAYPIPLYTSYLGTRFIQFNIGFVPTVGINFTF